MKGLHHLTLKQDIVDKKVDYAVLVAEECCRDLFLGRDRAHGVEQHEDAGESRGVVGVRHQMVSGQGEVADVAELPLTLDRPRPLLFRLWKNDRDFSIRQAWQSVCVSRCRWLHGRFPENAIKTLLT